MGMRWVGRGIAGGLVLVAASVSGSAGNKAVKVPCTGGKTTQYSLRACKVVKAAVAKAVDGGIAKKVDALYRNKKNPVCNPIEREHSTNRRGQSCGTYARITAEETKSQPGSREASYLRGAYVQALKSVTKSVIGELNSGRLQVSKACARPAAEYEKLLTEFQRRSKPGKDPMGREGRAPPRVARRQASRAALESAFVQLALCEVVGRADQRYKSAFFGSRFHTNLKKSVIEPCRNLCKASCAAQKTKQCITACLSRCWRGRYLPFFKREVEQQFP